MEGWGAKPTQVGSERKYEYAPPLGGDAGATGSRRSREHASKTIHRQHTPPHTHTLSLSLTHTKHSHTQLGLIPGCSRLHILNIYTFSTSPPIYSLSIITISIPYLIHTSSSRPPLAVTAARARAIETLSPCFLPAAANLGQEQAAGGGLEGGPQILKSILYTGERTNMATTDSTGEAIGP